MGLFKISRFLYYKYLQKFLSPLNLSAKMSNFNLLFFWLILFTKTKRRAVSTKERMCNMLYFLKRGK